MHAKLHVDRMHRPMQVEQFLPQTADHPIGRLISDGTLHCVQHVLCKAFHLTQLDITADYLLYGCLCGAVFTALSNDQ